MDKDRSKDLSRFDERYDSCVIDRVGGKLVISVEKLNQAVREMPSLCEKFVERQCFLAASNPGQLQSALFVAACYESQFADSRLWNRVLERAREFEAEDILTLAKQIKGPASAQEELTPRKRAKEWWAGQNADFEAHCDGCAEIVPRDQGYIVPGRTFKIGDATMNLGDELLCDNCYALAVAEYLRQRK
jgi:hypothetical protein